jgi:DNA-binding phage protein
MQGREFNPLECLDTEDVVALYLRNAKKKNPKRYLDAMAEAVQLHGVLPLAKATGLKPGKIAAILHPTDPMASKETLRKVAKAIDDAARGTALFAEPDGRRGAR